MCENVKISARGPEQIVDEDPHLESDEIDVASDDDLERVCERCGSGCGDVSRCRWI